VGSRYAHARKTAQVTPALQTKTAFCAAAPRLQLLNRPSPALPRWAKFSFAPLGLSARNSTANRSRLYSSRCSRSCFLLHDQVRTANIARIARVANLNFGSLSVVHAKAASTAYTPKATNNRFIPHQHSPIRKAGAQGRIRTSVARKERQIYSLLPLTTRPPVHIPPTPTSALRLRSGQATVAPVKAAVRPSMGPPMLESRIAGPGIASPSTP
jgi:hypothetical protein